VIFPMTGATATRRPPLWLAAVAVAGAWAAIYSIGRLVLWFVVDPVHEDVRLFYVAAEAGLRYGWPTIYNQDTLRALSSSFPAQDRTVDNVLTYLHPPLLAWLFIPLTVFPEPVAYLLWTLLSLAAFLFAWHIAAPYTGLAKVTALLVALGLWPVMQAFYYGQPNFLILALIAGAWWLARRDKMLAAGIAIAFATALKPQVVFMVPVCLVAAYRLKPVLAWAAGCVALAALFAVELGPSGIAAYWQALKLGQADAGHTFFTVGYLFALHVVPATYAILFIQGALCVFVAWRRRDDLDIVFAAGLLGSLVTSLHLHQPDYINLVLAAWLVLRGTPSLAHKLWFAAGVVTMQTLTLGQPVPQLLWDLGWLAILAVGGFTSQRALAPAAYEPARMSNS
jgi:glycosyl transferase family 87